MAQIYYDLIKKGLKTIDDVPVRWKAAVQALIDAEVY
jgi:hypothetical protein